MNSVFFISKVCTLSFFAVIFIVNMIELFQSRSHGQISSELYFEKQMWMIVCLLAIAIILGNF